MAGPTDYDAAVERGRLIHAGVRIGRPGHGWAYRPLHLLAQLLRLRYAVRVAGIQNVAPGPAIVIGNHLSAMDPVLVGLTSRWRLVFFTKIEAYEGASGLLIRSVGQIPLRRGDEESTTWALDMSRHVLAMGRTLGVYPEGTRSPDGRSLHRLHRRVLVPILQANPDVPVHAMAIAYPGRRHGRQLVDLRFSKPLSIDARTMTADEVTDAVRDALIELGGMPYIHTFARSVKARLAP